MKNLALGLGKRNIRPGQGINASEDYRSADSRGMGYTSSVYENDLLFGAEDMDEINRRMDSLFKESEERKITVSQRTPRSVNQSKNAILRLLEQHGLQQTFIAEELLESEPGQIAGSFGPSEVISANEKVRLICFTLTP